MRNNRTSLLTKTHRVLKKHYKPAPLHSDRTLLEHLVFACCVENSSAEAAERVFKSLVTGFFDWNEVRVSTVRELVETMRPLSDPERSAARVKRVLQSVFESIYSFDIEALKKQNIGQAVKKLEKYDGTTRFVVAYLNQVGLGGHSIPLNGGALHALKVIGAASEQEAQKGNVPGMERAIPKKKGVEFGSLLHQFGVDFSLHPFSPANRGVLLEIAPDCKDRLPKRTTKKPTEATEATAKTKGRGRAEPRGGAKKTAVDRKKAAGGEKAPAKKIPAVKKKTAAKARPGETGKKKAQTRKKSATKRYVTRKPR